ncbi:MAG TPA: hypothetical protein VN700_01275 [Vicinamibacterales bacterium]|nr:hypothetical protein [Vicinamibacterales bacterium]
MRTHPWLLVGSIGVTLAAAIAVSQWSGPGGAAIAAVAGLGWLLSVRCTHRHATLLPPVRGSGPDRDHARWYCDRCGKTWDSGLEPTTRPRVVFDGYDERKAMRASARADSLDKQRRRLATKRGGGSRRRPAHAPVAARSGPRPVEALLEQRAVNFTDHETARPFAAVRRS